MVPMIAGALINAGTQGLGMMTNGILTGRKKKFAREMANKQHQQELERLGILQGYTQDNARLEQQLAMGMYNYQFNKQAEYNSPEQEKARLEQAGLNPALLYGGGGSAGGQSVAASADGASVGAAPNIAPMGLQVGLQAMQVNAQNEVAASQAALNYAQAAKVGLEGKKTSAETDKINKDIEVATENIKQIKATVENTKEETKIKEFQNFLNDITKNVKFDKYVNGEKSGEFTYSEMLSNVIGAELKKRNIELSTEEQELLNRREVAIRLSSDLEKVAEGKLNELSLTETNLEKARYELSQDKALGDILQEMGGDAKYSKLLMLVINRLLK